MRGETVLKVRWNRRINLHRRFAINARLEEQRVYTMNFVNSLSWIIGNLKSKWVESRCGAAG